MGLIRDYDNDDTGLTVSVVTSSKHRWYAPRVHVITRADGEVECLYKDATLFEAWFIVRYYERNGYAFS